MEIGVNQPNFLRYHSNHWQLSAWRLAMHLARSFAVGFAGLWLTIASSSVASSEDGLTKTDDPKTTSKNCSEESYENLRRKTGLVDLYLDDEKRRVLLALPAPKESNLLSRFIYAPSIVSGLGSNPVGLDRGLLGDSHIVAFRKVGNLVILELENHTYHAGSGSAAERAAVRNSFPSSTIWSEDIECVDEHSQTILVDISDFLTGYDVGIAKRLRRKKQGKFSIKPDRSYPVTSGDGALVFPNNFELDAVVTYVSNKPGGEIKATTPDPNAVTLKLHHSFIRLPDEGFAAREFDPRAGVFDIESFDFGASLDEPLRRRLARRFRLRRGQPLVFHVDPGMPKQIRSAVSQGVLWWQRAFEAAGFRNAIEVKTLGPDQHPLDVRHNVVLWVHRQTRGWSNGKTIYDPRTGEVLKGVVRLGSQRVRHLKSIFEGLTHAGAPNTTGESLATTLALQRISQLAAHEVGHVFGLRHNFAASSDERASVMDYPAPVITVGEDGELDFSKAYTSGVGAWDIQAIRWLYSEIPSEKDEKEALNKIIDAGTRNGLRYATDCDARSSCYPKRAPAHPLANIWDNGSDPAAELQNVLAVRRVALDRFGTANLAKGRPLFELQKVFPPIYLFHRYQVKAAAKSVGGYIYAQRIVGDGRPAATPVEPDKQRRALTSVLKTLDPETLQIPERILNLLIPSNSSDFDPNGEAFAGMTIPVFDQLLAADAAANITMKALLHPGRLARLIEFHRRDARFPGAMEILNAVDGFVFDKDAPVRPSTAEIQRTVQTRFISEMISVGSNRRSPMAVKTRIRAKLRALHDRLETESEKDYLQREHNLLLAAMISRYLDRNMDPEDPDAASPETPPGRPIGSGSRMRSFESCWHCDLR